MSLKDSYESNYTARIAELDSRIARVNGDYLKMSSGERLAAGGEIDKLLQKRRDLDSRLSEIRNYSESNWNELISSQQIDFE